MKYAHQYLVTTVSLIAIVPLLTVPAGAGEIHGKMTDYTDVWLAPHGLKSSVGSSITAIGVDALRDNISGGHNTAVGYKVLSNNTKGNYNTASGAFSLMNNSTGRNNTASGHRTLPANRTGNYNTAIGSHALQYSRLNYNTAIGYKALNNNNNGKENTAIGAESLKDNQLGHYNVSSGYHALWKNVSGSSNTANGAGALRDNKYGGRNTAIGFRAGARNKGGHRNVFIGYEAGYNREFTNLSDRLIVANGRNHKNHLIIGNFKKQTLVIRGHLSASSVKETSDARLKKDIQPLTHALDSILQLQGKTYRWKEDTTFANKADIGLVAQDVEKIFPELVAEDERGYKAIAYSKLTAVLIEAMKEQQGQMVTQQDQIAALEKENALLKTIMADQMQALLARVAMLEGETLVAN